MTPLPQIPGYELLRPLGGGPLTQVFAGKDCQDNQPCAVKLLRPHWEDPETAILLLRREARAGLAMRHPHVIRYLKAHVLKPPYFLVVRLLEGESLRKRLITQRRIDTTSAINIARQTAAGLAALHQRGYLHGDLKPENIYILPGDQVQLIDLGLAHRPGENAPLIEQGYVLGTPDYLAPEMCAFEPEIDEGADLFSLGVVIYEMLAGVLPYPRGSTHLTLRYHRERRPAEGPVHELALPAPLQGLIWRLLASKSADRPRAAAVEVQLRALESRSEQGLRAA